MAESTGQTFSALLRGFNELSPQRKLGLMVALAVVIALFIGSMMWAQAPDYRVLYGNLSDRDGGTVIDALQKQNIPYKTGDGGMIMVPSNMVYEARLKLASQGLPKGGSVGFELMDNQKFGITQFQENVNYQRALEGEITRTIETIASVQGARVHLAIPKPTVFVREEQKPSASVLVNLYAGRELDKAQVAGIVHLIAGSVPEMPPGNVTIIDQNGKMLTSAGSGGAAGLDSSQLEYLRDVEQSYAKRIQDIITPIVGAENIRAQVTADLDFSMTEQTAETYKPNPTPDQASIRSQQTSEASGDSGSGPAGVPGALSNQPPGAATAPINAPAGKPGAPAAGATSGAGAHKESTVNYELDKTISHVRKPVGSIKRLSVAVVVNNKGEKDKKGKVTYRPLTKDEVAQVYNLAKEAMGFSQQRGDTLNVVNAPFNLDVGEEVPPLPIWKDPAMQALAKEVVKYLLIAGLLMYLVLGVLKPMMHELVVAGRQEAEAARAAAAAEAEGIEAAAGGVGEVVHLGGRKPHSYEEDLQLVKDMAKTDPKIVANVVKDWVNKE